MRVTVKFRVFKRQGSKSCKCQKCGKKLRRQITLTETENPWNLNEVGVQKSPKEIHESLGRRIEQWKREPVICSACEEIR